MTDGGITYRPLPSTEDFQTRHGAIGAATHLNRVFDTETDPEFEVVAVDAEDRRIMDKLLDGLADIGERT